MHLVERVLTGERLALARLLTQVENDTPTGQAALDELFPSGGKAHLVGITGAPGTGKSSLVNQVARLFRQPGAGVQPAKVAIVAVDPSSPFTGGALLGDRVRMRDLAGDPGIFIRSMAARGALGGLARSTAGVVEVLDAAGFDLILIETVGAGQNEVDIVRLAHTTIVVEAPGMGDDIQAIKAGLLEIADILVINKADRPGVENTTRALKAMLELGRPGRGYAGKHTLQENEKALDSVGESQSGWMPPILTSIATLGEGAAEIVQAIRRHGEYLKESGEWGLRQRERLQNELEDLLQAGLVARWRSRLPDDVFQASVDAVVGRKISPQQAVAKLLNFGVNYEVQN
jgi:LAO/AO transport system kinase